MESYVKIEILLENRNLCKNRNLGNNRNLCKNRNLGKNRNFGEKLNCWSTIEIILENRSLD